MQTQADILGAAVERSRSADVSALGAAFLAGLAAGVWRDESEISDLLPARDRFTPQIGADERAARWERWRQALSLVLR
jgi:glycerol kinase